ncbi:MAG TPA: CBS domain-containing protein [Methylocella sp.]|nr:CBS domain-containing protein [Methylocella sp.]
MTVARILSEKGRNVVMTQPHRTVAEAAWILAENNIGALVVTDARERILGIFTERDIVRVIGRLGSAALGDAVSKYMTTCVETVHEDESVDMAMEKMTLGRFRHLPVVSGDRLDGIVSIGDVVKHRLETLEHEHRAMREYIAHA